MNKSKITHSGNLILLGFGLAIVAMSFLVYKVLKQDFQLVTDNYYEKELVYEDYIVAEKNLLPYKDSVTLVRADNNIVLTLPATITSQLSSGTIHFYAPADSKFDKTYNLAANPGGQYIFPLSDLKASFYKPKITFEAGGKNYATTLLLNL